MSNQPRPTFKPRFDYAPMMKQVYEASGEWVELPVDQLAGDTLKEKQGAVTRAGTTRKLNVQTTTHEGRLYARLRVFPSSLSYIPHPPPPTARYTSVRSSK